MKKRIKAVNDYLNEIFGELGNTLTDALVDSFEQGTNAADAFGEAAGNMLKNLAKQVLYTATIGPEIEKAQKKIDAINRDLSLSDEERYNALAGVVDTMLDDVLAQQKVGQELWERLKQAAEERGLPVGGRSSGPRSDFSRFSGYVSRYRRRVKRPIHGHSRQSHRHSRVCNGNGANWRNYNRHKQHRHFR